jgi:hypothetical protein
MANPLYIGVGLLGIGLLGILGGKAGAASASSRVATPRSLGSVTDSRAKLTTSGSQDARVLIAEARARFPARTISVEQMTAARLIASEHGSGNASTQACIVDAELNRAARRGLSLLSHLTGATGIYGRQGNHGGVRRPAATRQNPTLRHLEIAQAVLDGDARGISRGAERFFDPRVQNGTHRRYKAARLAGEKARIIASCSALGTLKAWSYDLPECEPSRCCTDLDDMAGFGKPPADGKRGRSPDAWVGHIAGVDPTRLALMKPSKYGAAHDRAYNELKAIIESMG